jgi:hypothetical protein
MSVMGDVLGYDVDGEMEGDVDGDIPGVVGRHHRRNKGRQMQLAERPGWRGGQLAPGLQGPSEGLVPLPMTPLQNSGVFTATVPAITYSGQLQRPFRAERFLCPPAVRTGTSAVGRLLGQFFVGVALQQTEIFGIDLEIIGAPTLFGGRMTMQQAEPGVLIRIPVVLSVGLAGTDTIYASMFFLGRVVH